LGIENAPGNKFRSLENQFSKTAFSTDSLALFLKWEIMENVPALQKRKKIVKDTEK
jgi:hypothetical protein